MLDPDQPGRGRKHLAESLRELRRAAGLSGARLAARAAMSQSKISRIESGKVLPTVVDVARILRALDVPTEASQELVSLARVANVDYLSWRMFARVGLWRRQAEIHALAASSSVVRHFLPAIPSGLIQCPEYARAALTPTIAGRPARDVERAARARLDSQEALNDRTRRFAFLLTEQAVRWQRAEPAVMVAQLRHLADVATRPNVDLAIVPTGAAVSASPLHMFVVYDERLVTVELFAGGLALRDPQEVAYHLSIFDYFRQHAIAGDRALTMIGSIESEFMRALD